MAKIELSDVNQTLSGQGKYLQEISKDTGLFASVAKFFLLGQTFDNYQRNQVKNTLRDVEEQSKKQTEETEKQTAATHMQSTLVQMQTNAITSMTDAFHGLRMTFMRLNNTIEKQTIGAARRARVARRAESGAQLDLLERLKEDSQPSNIEPGGVLNSLNAFPGVGFPALFATSQGGYGNVTIDGGDGETEESLGSKALGLLETGLVVTGVTSTVKTVAGIFKKTGDDVEAKRGPLRTALNNAIERIKNFMPGDAPDATKPKKFLTGARLASNVTAAGARSDLAFLDDVIDDFDVQQKYRTFQKYGANNIQDVRKRMANIDTPAGDDLAKKFKFPGMKQVGRFFTGLVNIAGGMFLAMDMYEMFRLNAAIKAKQREVGSENLTQAELADAYRSVTYSLAGDSFRTPEQIAGQYPEELLGENLKTMSVTAIYDEIKAFQDREELARRREEERRAATYGTGGPPNRNMINNTSTSSASFYNNGLVTGDDTDLFSGND
jgi:hypothetical protein